MKTFGILKRDGFGKLRQKQHPLLCSSVLEMSAGASQAGSPVVLTRRGRLPVGGSQEVRGMGLKIPLAFMYPMRYY